MSDELDSGKTHWENNEEIQLALECLPTKARGIFASGRAPLPSKVENCLKSLVGSQDLLEHPLSHRGVSRVLVGVVLQRQLAEAPPDLVLRRRVRQVQGHEVSGEARRLASCGRQLRS
eukprot:CAMPEP_0204582788 /NCGR_PEP_ID=MMETSP0661-20131031/45415_1 /ASSEMBLY_ACC=CAM_ASM_000606 /TAXON_ID=109239 /ORGANISM="Alexandrium margalefi, Strain AMGDE01CS-322" /LENGTH=117 /DNA_ID=CAMNT_0051592097 /DNA_START=82 /DNA_END=432 /DNA_ORIENTATION=+